MSQKSWLVDMLLCLFLGYLGVHRFYEGKVVSGVIYLLTGGILGIGAMIDFVIILCGGATDSLGRSIKP
ncbi:MAG: TM2 domain-containing protein [Kiritimatiellae bacterium]|nr:TM2 domain-containing protein [Kiritimatiellia bacterium]